MNSGDCKEVQSLLIPPSISNFGEGSKPVIIKVSVRVRVRVRVMKYYCKENFVIKKVGNPSVLSYINSTLTLNLNLETPFTCTLFIS